jgi:iron complex transport system ATP-binding protein
MLAVSGARFAYGDRVALRDVSLEIGETALVALAGPNGSGKSTLLKLMARVATPEAGDVRFLGKSLREWKPKAYAQQTGYLPQEPDASFPMRALEVVVSGRAPFLTRFGFESGDDYREAAAALELCDAAYLAERYLDEMSGGERKRVFLARALAQEPRVALLDEPTAHLDLRHVAEIFARFGELRAERGLAVVATLHDLNAAAMYADRVLLLKDGMAIGWGAPHEVLTEEKLREVYETDVYVGRNPATGAIAVLPGAGTTPPCR